jgi:hypothetical protein
MGEVELKQRWQDIETAPKKDGFLAIVYCPENCKEERVMMGEYSRTRGWSIHIDAQLIDPTHWMPLPEPPAKP